MNPACQSFVPMLSAFIDGELSASERVTVERHLAACPECTMRVADLRAESGLLRVGMDMLTDDVDFKDFSQKVMARITPERPPLWERVRLSFSEAFLYHRRMMVTSFASAALAVIIAVPFILRAGAPMGYASQRLAVQSVSTEEGAHVAPVVMETEGGDAIIWIVDHNHPDASTGEEGVEGDTAVPHAVDKMPLHQEPPKGGEL